MANETTRRRPTKRGNGEGSIYQRADGLWCGSLSLDRGRRKTIYGKTRKDVARKLAIAVQARDDGTIVVAPRQTLAQFIERWLEDSVKPTTRPRSHLSYKDRMRLHILPDLGALQLTAITPQHLQQLYSKLLKSGLSSTTINSSHMVLHRALKQALRWGLIARSPADAVDVPRKGRPKADPFQPDELGIFLAAIQGDVNEPLWITLLGTGLRFGEVAALRWSDVDLDEHSLTVRHTIVRQGNKGYAFAEPKTRSSRREIPMPAAVIDALRRQRIRATELQLLARDWPDLDLVFPSAIGTPIRETKYIEVFHETLEHAGLRRRRIHDLRHTYATRLFALNNHPRAVQELMGHSSFEITMNIYTASVPSVLRDAANSLDAMFHVPDGSDPIVANGRRRE